MRMVGILFMFMLILPFSTVQGGKEWENVELKRYGIGNQQSPIDIQNPDVQLNNNLGKLKMEYLPETATLNKLDHEIQVAWSGYAGNVEIEGLKYKLLQCHWHHPSEHTIDNKQYPLELHMVHQSDDGNIAVIGIVYEIGPPNHFLTTLREAINQIASEEKVELGAVDANEIEVGFKSAYYRYTGSLTTPPYTEGVIWTVIKQVRTVSEQQVNSLREALGEDNSRPVQPINGRIVELFEPYYLGIEELSEMYEGEQAILSGSS